MELLNLWILVVLAGTSQLHVTDAGVPYRRQVLPPIPGYIPVYIQHGDVPPEDHHEYAEIFQVADRNIPPRVSATIFLPTTTTEMKVDDVTEVVSNAEASVTTRDDNMQNNPGVSESNCNRNETPSLSDDSETEVGSNAVPEENVDKNDSSENLDSEKKKLGSVDNDISKLDASLLNDSIVETEDRTVLPTNTEENSEIPKEGNNEEIPKL